MGAEIPGQRMPELLFAARQAAFSRMIREGLRATEAYLALSPEDRREALQPEQDPAFTAATREYTSLCRPEIIDATLDTLDT